MFLVLRPGAPTIRKAGGTICFTCLVDPLPNRLPAQNMRRFLRRAQFGPSKVIPFSIVQNLDDTRLTSRVRVSLLLPVPQAHARTVSVLVDKDDAGRLEGLADGG